MKVYAATWAQDFNCPECGISLECDEVGEGAEEVVCPECNTKLHLIRRIKYTVRVV